MLNLNRKIEILLEKYYSMEESRSIIVNEVLSILQSPSHYNKIDKNYLKMIFKLGKFKPGLIEIAKLENNEQEMLAINIEDNNFDGIIQTCNNYTTKDKSIWVQAFNYFINYENTEKIGDYLSLVLNKIADNNLLSPIVVLQALKKRKNIKFEVYKQYLAKSMGDKMKEMSSDKKEFEDYYSQIKSANKKLNNIKTKPMYYNCQSCTVCKESFTVYINSNVSNISKIIVFKCGHAFHPLCLNIQDRVESSNDDYTCPECSYKYEQINKRIQIIYDNANDHNTFFMQLSKKDNKFDFIAKNLGRGAISNIT